MIAQTHPVPELYTSSCTLTAFDPRSLFHMRCCETECLAMAADKSRVSALSKDIMLQLCLSSNWPALSPSDRVETVCCRLITSSD